ncbi:MAG: hypothetical protein HOG68_00310 [Candidatus Marinimicrobia bacterium]|jgi:hypothetical protein|nr:hypothetical protein [Candidatus Neomarinimicrobiota bacterium]
MDPVKLHFDFRDIFRAPRLALSGKKIWTFMVGNFLGYSGYFLFTYIALFSSGISIIQSWERFGLYPLVNVFNLPWFSLLIYFAGVLCAFIMLSLSCAAVSRITYKQLKGNDFYSSADAWNYIKKHWHPVVFTLIALSLIIAFFVLMAGAFALLGKIPFIGEFLFAIPYPLYFLGALFTLYSFVVIVVASIYIPIIVGSYEEDTMGTVFQSYVITWSQPWRIIAYHLILLPIFSIATAIFYGFFQLSFEFVNSVFGWVIGDKLNHIVDAAVSIVCPPLYAYGSVAGLSGTEWLSSGILAFFFFLLMLAVIGYSLSILSVGETLMFIIFKMKSDDDNILARKDEEELEEEENEDVPLDKLQEDDSSQEDNALEESTSDSE